MHRAGSLLPLIFAVAIAYLVDAGAIGLGAALGAGAFLSLLLARRSMPVKFGALSLAGAVAFGFIAAVLASLYGMPVNDLMESAESSHLMAKAMGVAAVTLAVLGASSLTWGTLFGHPPEAED